MMTAAVVFLVLSNAAAWLALLGMGWRKRQHERRLAALERECAERQAADMQFRDVLDRDHPARAFR